MKTKSMIGLWLRVSALTSLVIIGSLLIAVVVGHSMTKRIIAFETYFGEDISHLHLLEVDRGIQHTVARDLSLPGFLWSVDGHQIGFASLDGWAVMDWTGNNRRLVMDSDNWMLPMTTGTSYFDSEWNTSKTKRIFTGYKGFSICKLKCENAEHIFIGYDIRHPTWSPDEQQILYASGQEGYLEIFLMKSDGTDTLQLTHQNFDHWYPDWSHDGQQILFSGNFEIYVMDADGNNLRRVTHNQMFELYPAWQP